MIGLPDGRKSFKMGLAVTDRHPTNPGRRSIYRAYYVARVKQETQLSLTNSAMHWCRCNGVADLLKTRPSPPICVTKPNLVALWCRHTYRSSPKLGSIGTLLSWDGRLGWHQNTRPSPTCVTTTW